MEVTIHYNGQAVALSLIHICDTSRKIRSVFKSKGMSGKHLTGTVIYGYLWDEKREHWLVDEEAATVGALADVLRQSTVWYLWWD